MKDGYFKTFYIFGNGVVHTVPITAPNAYFKWQDLRDIAFSLDPTGSNLPPLEPPWKFETEIQPTHKFAYEVPDEQQVWRGLDEKGWYIAQAVVRVSQFKHLIIHSGKPEKSPPRKLSDAAEKLSRQLDALQKK